MHRANPNQSELLELAKKFIDLLKDWILMREATIRTIEAIARELQDVKLSTNIGKVVGGAVAVGGGLAAVVGTVLTGGFATPLIIGGIVGAVAGGVTSAGAEIAEKFISKGRLESALKVLNKDAESCKRILNVKSEFDSEIKALCRIHTLDFQEVQCSLLMAAMISGTFNHEDHIKLVELDLTSEPITHILQKVFGIECPLGNTLSHILAEVSFESAAKAAGGVVGAAANGSAGRTAGRVAGEVAGKVMVGLILVWDIYSLVTDCIELGDGSPSESANCLKEMASIQTNHVNDIKDLWNTLRHKKEHHSDLDEVLKLAEKYMDLLKEWIPKREETIRAIADIAKELQGLKQGANIGKVVGGAVAVVGGFVAFVGSVLAGGVATPLIVGGIVGAVAGGVTCTTSEVIETLKSKGKLESAQEVLNKDAESCKSIEKAKSKFDSKIEDLCRFDDVLNINVQSIVLIAAMDSGPVDVEDRIRLVKWSIDFDTRQDVFDEVFSSFGFELYHILAEIANEDAARVAEWAAEGAAGRAAARVVGKVAGKVMVGLILVWDIYSLVSDSIELGKGSQSEAAKCLQKVADEQTKYVDKIKRFVETLSGLDGEVEKHLRVLDRTLGKDVSAL